MAEKPCSHKPTLIQRAKCINFIDIDTHHIFHTIFTLFITVFFHKSENHVSTYCENIRFGRPELGLEAEYE